MSLKVNEMYAPVLGDSYLPLACSDTIVIEPWKSHVFVTPLLLKPIMFMHLICPFSLEKFTVHTLWNVNFFPDWFKTDFYSKCFDLVTKLVRRALRKAAFSPLMEVVSLRAE